MVNTTYPSDPDGRVDVDRGAGPTPATKQAVLVSEEDHQQAQGERDGYHGLDAEVESSPGLRRAAKDRARAVPRATPAPLGHPLKERKLPERAASRTAFSSRQRTARSVMKHQVQDRLSATQHRELDGLLRTDPGRWQDVNDALSQVRGDVQQLSEERITQVQRVDRAIQMFESLNDRSHVVYTNVKMPAEIRPDRVSGYLRKNFNEGTEVAFDRFSLGAHTIDEIETPDRDPRGMVVFEVQTRRGMYLGQSGSGSSSAHLLPRGLRLWVLSTQPTLYTRADGTTTWRDLVTLTDIPPQERKKDMKKKSTKSRGGTS